ncbi:hypothetical protein PHSY_006789 [Pseudozyma hubeiensis SY62]|uniref:Wbp11/ELF5/Saf1 N-terminal domain-containing protein n=1 Tax=Pseudozyma hubeiensis (strain SY62) TaxID=1305764 RepID=R9PCV1_PSEHS|nr:hypothetical protein PHSY_006789 [Pseudozyma hubeiensis SY62]GAC99189.1 hypothetical protein PHSY_006789 [Pseudozyma hubeiensis SY62]
MARSTDPVQAARKAAIKREAQRNRERKQQANQARTLRQDTTSLERKVQRLETSRTALSPEEQEELKRLQDQVASVKRIKEEYIRKHPDQRNFVRGYEQPSDSFSESRPGSSSASQTHNVAPSIAVAPSHTTAQDPRWSIYYDAVFNPYGAPPPGMPYLEKPHAQLVQEGLLDAAKPPPLPEETQQQGLGVDDDSDDSSVDEDLKDIIMPSGPPPIRLLPEAASSGIDAVHLNRGAGRARGRGPPGRGNGGPTRGTGGTGRSSRPAHLQQRGGPVGGQIPQYPASLPPRPPFDPSIRPPAPHATASALPVQACGPSRPPGPPPAVPDGVIISAEPQLRDLKKEATAFVPAAIRKKRQEEKARTQRGLPGRIDAAPTSSDMTHSPSASAKDRTDLLKSLQAHLPPTSVATSTEGSGKTAADKGKKDYDRFLDEVADLL